MTVASDQRNRAIGTAVITAIRDLEIGGIGIVGQFSVSAIGIGKLVVKQFRKQFREFWIVLDLHEKIDFRKFLKTVFKIALDKAAGNYQFLQSQHYLFPYNGSRKKNFLFERPAEEAEIF